MNHGSDFEWFPLYVRDLLSSRAYATLTTEQFGQYLKLLCWQWKDGPLPTDADALRTLCGGNAIALRGVLDFFVETPGGYINENLERIRQDQEDQAEKVSAAGRKAAKSRWRSKKRGNAIALRPQSDGNAVAMRSDATETETKTETKHKERATEARTSPHQIGEGPAHDMATLLATLILENDKSARMPATTEPWAVAIQRMQISDTRDWGEIEQVIRYSQRSDHWRSCVLDAVGLVKHYRRIRLQVDRGNGKDRLDPAPQIDRFVYAELENQLNEGGIKVARAWIETQRVEFHGDLARRLETMLETN